jgi:hypothetical protein
MIVALCGSHGTGKSTVIKEAIARGIKVSDAQLSRTAQAKLGWETLTRAQDSLENMWLLQNAVVHAMLERDEALDSEELNVVERSPADAWAYTRMWLTRHGIDPYRDPEAIIYRKTLETHAKMAYDAFVIIPIREEIPFVEEPNRADLASREQIDQYVREFIYDCGLRYYVLKTLGPEHRGMELESYLIALKGL